MLVNADVVEIIVLVGVCLMGWSSLLVGFQDVAFLLSRASFSTTFLLYCGRDESLGTTICLGTTTCLGTTICLAIVEHIGRLVRMSVSGYRC